MSFISPRKSQSLGAPPDSVPAERENGINPNLVSAFNVTELARELQAIADRLKISFGNIHGSFALELDADHSNMVLSEIKERSRRRQHFPTVEFADPAWDILLDLYHAELRQFRVSKTSLCIAANVPPTTALRWIDKMVEDGVLCSARDPLDARRVFMSLSNEMSLAMKCFYQSKHDLNVNRQEAA